MVAERVQAMSLAELEQELGQEAVVLAAAEQQESVEVAHRAKTSR